MFVELRKNPFHSMWIKSVLYLTHTHTNCSQVWKYSSLNCVVRTVRSHSVTFVHALEVLTAADFICCALSLILTLSLLLMLAPLICLFCLWMCAWVELCVISVMFHRVSDLIKRESATNSETKRRKKILLIRIRSKHSTDKEISQRSTMAFKI